MKTKLVFSLISLVLVILTTSCEKDSLVDNSPIVSDNVTTAVENTNKTITLLGNKNDYSAYGVTSINKTTFSPGEVIELFGRITVDYNGDAEKDRVASGSDLSGNRKIKAWIVNYSEEAVEVEGRASILAPNTPGLYIMKFTMVSPLGGGTSEISFQIE